MIKRLLISMLLTAAVYGQSNVPPVAWTPTVPADLLTRQPIPWPTPNDYVAFSARGGANPTLTEIYRSQSTGLWSNGIWYVQTGLSFTNNPNFAQWYKGKNAAYCYSANGSYSGDFDDALAGTDKPMHDATDDATRAGILQDKGNIQIAQKISATNAPDAYISQPFYSPIK